MQRLATGAAGEERAARWYDQHGYDVVARNWRCKEGELDLVAVRRRDALVVICEVKTRSSDRFGTAAEAVGWDKQRRLRVLAARWLADPAAPARHRGVRFDVACIQAGRLEVIEAAF